jgi:flagellar protein FlbB
VKKVLLPLALFSLALYLFAPALPGMVSSLAEARSAGTAVRGPSAPADDAASLELKREQLAEREAALNAKEQALKRLSAQLDARVNELNAAKKGIEASLVAKKKQDDERYKKMIKIYKALKPEDAAGLLNKLDARMVIEMLNLMDQKTAVKLIPYLHQPRVLEWTRSSLAGK